MYLFVLAVWLISAGNTALAFVGPQCVPWRPHTTTVVGCRAVPTFAVAGTSASYLDTLGSVKSVPTTAPSLVSDPVGVAVEYADNVDTPRSNVELLDECLLVSSSDAARMILDRLSESGRQDEARQSMLRELLGVVDDGQDSAWWTGYRVTARFSQRARRASLRRLLDLSTPEDDDDKQTNDDTDDQRSRRRALALLVRTLAESSGDTTTTRRRWWTRPAVSTLEKAARRESTANTSADLASMLDRKPAGLETPVYTVLDQRPSYQVREYDPFTLCSVSMTNNKKRPPSTKTDAAVSNPQLQGASSFGALAGYLFGKNDQTTAMKMTTPVFTTNNNDDKQMSFVLPSTYWGEDGTDNCPQPLEGSGVTLSRRTKRVEAVLLFGGFATKTEVAKRERDLLQALQRDQDWTTPDGTDDAPVTFTLAQYNDPFTPPWKRRNEVSVPVFAVTKQ